MGESSGGHLRTLLLLLLLACGGPAVEPLPAPWEPASAAVGQGTVAESGATSLHVTYTDAPADVATAWKRAYEASGFKVVESTALPHMRSLNARRGTESYDLLITRAGTRADVLVTPSERP